MSGALVLGRLFGITVRVHFSWVFIFALVAWSLASFFLPDTYPGWTPGTYWIVGILGSLLLFASVLVHELSHSLVAMSRGLRVRSITLFFLGGVSEIEEEAQRPGEEFWISVVGPLTSLALGVVFAVITLVVRGANPQLEALVRYLTFINFTLGVFNLMPAFPLDGGRVLKAAVWKATGSYSRAVVVSSVTGSVFGLALIAVGIFMVFSNSLVNGLWFIFIGWFIQSAASSAQQQQVVRRALSGRLVRDAMRRDFPVVPPGITVQALIDDYVGRDFQRAYVVALGDTLHGLVSVSDLKRVPPEERPRRWVSEVMTRAQELKTVSPDDPLEVALRKLIAGDVSQLVVVEDGRPVGLVTRGDVLRVLEVSQLFPRV